MNNIIVTAKSITIQNIWSLPKAYQPVIIIKNIVINQQSVIYPILILPSYTLYIIIFNTIFLRVTGENTTSKYYYNNCIINLIIITSLA